MDTAIILSLVKARLGISTNLRDDYLKAIINGLVEELVNEQGIRLEEDNDNHLMFVTDYTVHRYQSRDASGGLPKHLMFRLKNLYITSGGGKNV